MVFVTVKHGANEQTLFNRDCRCVTLLNAIREKCCESTSNKDVIDLSDKDGNVKDLRKYPNMAAKEVLADREDVVLLKVGENEKGKLVYTPMLECEEVITKAFLDKLAKGSKRESSKAKAAAGGAGGRTSHHQSSAAAARKADHQSTTATSSASSFGKKPASSAAGQQHNKRR